MRVDKVFMGFHMPKMAVNSQPSNKLTPNDATSLEIVDGTRLFAAALLNSSVGSLSTYFFNKLVMFLVISKGFHNQEEVEGKTQ